MAATTSLSFLAPQDLSIDLSSQILHGQIENVESLDMTQYLTLRSAIRKIGAEIFHTQHAVFEELNAGVLPKPENLLNLYIDMLNFSGDFTRSLSTTSSHSRAVNSIFEQTRIWYGSLCKNEWSSFEEAKQETKLFFDRIISAYAELNWVSVMQQYPEARKHNLLLLDFDTHVVGISKGYLHKTAELFNSLTIDPNLKIPQEGFYGQLPDQVFFSTAQILQSKLFVALKDGEVHGFSLPTYNQEATKEILGSNYQELISKGVISKDDTIGWLHFVGTEKKSRVSLARSHINIYNILHNAVCEDAVREGVNVLLGCVREGENRNTAINAHIRQGWQLTDCTYLGKDGKTVYRLLKLPLCAPLEDFERPIIGFQKFGEIRSNDPCLYLKEIESAVMISNADALEICKNCFDKRCSFIKSKITMGERVYIEVSDGARSVHLHQIMPGFDLWTMFGTNYQGSMSSLLPYICNSFGFRYVP